MTTLPTRFARAAIAREAERRQADAAQHLSSVAAVPEVVRTSTIIPVARSTRRIVDVGQAVGPITTRMPIPNPDGPVRGAIQPSMPDLPDGMLKKVLDTQDRAAQKSRIGADTHTHASTISNGVCARHYILNERYDKQEWESTTGGHRLMWAYGRAAEAHIRRQVLTAAGLPFTFWGRWACVCKKTSVVGTRPRIPQTCRNCNTPANVFHEEPLYDHDNGIIGNCDLAVSLNGWMIPFEFKSMTADQFDKLEEPLSGNVRQVLEYWHLFKINGFRVHNKVGLVYAKKEFKFGSPYKEFHIDATSPQNQRILQGMLETGRTIHHARGASEYLPPRLPVCTSAADPAAKRCPRVALCFNMPEGSPCPR